ncbi:MAG: Lrp/AsnC family transcriptional regulator [Magnetococcales bacterium]|nr:Lrp/AsnC family transcriptional regulator [Magnetococcales bacterium]NGZ25300.1 Lrp/AsnC family transcriptional regulator [Magnetococcales bacterium]
MMRPDGVEVAILNHLQAGFPVERHPFAAAAAPLNLTEEQLIARIGQMVEKGFFSRFAPLVNAERLGGAVTLVAMRIPAGELEKVALQVNAFPQVSQNYGRDHAFNLWFVLSTADKGEIATTLDAIEHATGHPVYPMPKKTEYRVGFRLLIAEDGSVHTASWQDPPPREGQADERDRAIIAAMQAGVPLEPTPYDRIAEQVGMLVEEVMERVEKLLACGIFRRLGGVPNHYRLGVRANGMSVWAIPEERVDQLGERVAKLDFITHCYHRPSPYPDWSFNLFAMIHAQERGQVLARAEQVRQVLGEDLLGWDILFSTTVWKKTGLRLATPDS